MTVKFVNIQTISLRPQNDNEKILLEHLIALNISGKKPRISMNEKGDVILEVKSEQVDNTNKEETDEKGKVQE